jgi:2,4-dienoyl-CoA reductase [(3E)-enoyl-CoA-producing], mitochondrial
MFKSDLLEGRVILITGGGTGLGRCMAENFASYGAKVAIAGRRLEVLEKTAAEISPREGAVLPVQCDVSDIHQVEDMVETVTARLGEIDILVNNAAGNFISPTEKITPNAFKIVLDIVLMGSVNCTMVIGKRWIAQGRKGTVLSMSANYAHLGSGYVVPSACAKAGVETLMRSLAAEWGKYGLRFVAIAPSAIPTEGAWQRINPGGDVMDPSIVPLKRVGKTQELADLATYLVSPSAEYITGEVIRLDGGVTLRGAGFWFLDDVTPEQWKSYRKMVR